MSDHGKKYVARFALQGAELLGQRKKMIDNLALTNNQIRAISDGVPLEVWWSGPVDVRGRRSAGISAKIKWRESSVMPVRESPE